MSENNTVRGHVADDQAAVPLSNPPRVPTIKVTPENQNQESKETTPTSAASPRGYDSEMPKEVPRQPQQPRVELKAVDPGVREQLGFGLPLGVKWRYLSIIFLVQVSMNLNTTLYSNGIPGMARQFGVTADQARWGAAIFLITYAFGCELWAPWSEEFGRKRVLQLSLFLVNCFGLLVALAPNFTSVLVGRALGGLMTAGGSVTLAVIADIFDHDDPWFQYATLFIVASSVGGSIIGPIIGAPIELYLNWRWCMWVQLLFGGVVQLLHLFFVNETRATVLLDRIARKMREDGENVYGPGELAQKRIDWHELFVIWMRPFRFFVSEPIVFALSLLSGFSDALIFMFIQSFTFIYPEQWGFGVLAMSTTFLPLFIGYMIAYISFIPPIRRNIRQREKNPTDQHALYEGRLWWLLYTAPGLPIGLLIFALTVSYPVHWIGSMVATCLIGITNFAIYMATIDYMLRAYGPYAASATGGNGWARDFLAGVLTPAAIPMYRRLGTFDATMTLFAIACVLTLGAYLTYYRGGMLRTRSKFAQSLAEEEKRVPGGVVNFLPNLPGSRATSRGGTPAGSRPSSPQHRSPAGSQRDSSTGTRGVEPNNLAVPSSYRHATHTN